MSPMSFTVQSSKRTNYCLVEQITSMVVHIHALDWCFILPLATIYFVVWIPARHRSTKHCRWLFLDNLSCLSSPKSAWLGLRDDWLVLLDHWTESRTSEESRHLHRASPRIAIMKGRNSLFKSITFLWLLFLSTPRRHWFEYIWPICLWSRKKVEL